MMGASRQFALAVAIVVAPVLLGLIVIFLLMVVSGHEVAIVAGIVVFAGVLAAIVARGPGGAVKGPGKIEAG